MNNQRENVEIRKRIEKKKHSLSFLFSLVFWMDRKLVERREEERKR